MYNFGTFTRENSACKALLYAIQSKILFSAVLSCMQKVVFVKLLETFRIDQFTMLNENQTFFAKSEKRREKVSQPTFFIFKNRVTCYDNFLRT